MKLGPCLAVGNVKGEVLATAPHKFAARANLGHALIILDRPGAALLGAQVRATRRCVNDDEFY